MQVQPEAQTKKRSRPRVGGNLGSFLLPAAKKGPRPKSVSISIDDAVESKFVSKVEAPEAPPPGPTLPFSQELRGMFENSPSFRAAWLHVSVIARTERRLLIRAGQLAVLLIQLKTTRYRMEQHGLRIFCCLGSRTTLYRLSAALAVYVRAAAGHAVPLEAVIKDLERTIFQDLHAEFGADLHWKDLASILGGVRARNAAVAADALVPSIHAHRCFVFPLHALEQALLALDKADLTQLAPTQPLSHEEVEA